MPRDIELLKSGWKPEPATEGERELAAQIDIADYEVYSRKLELFCFEARDIMVQMGVSPMIQAGDIATGIYTARGDLASGFLGTHLHLVNGQLAIKYVIKHFLSDPSVGVKPGDMFYVNDGLYGGIHPPDQLTIMPIFHDGELMGWSSAASHETDTGAIEPGGMPPSAKTRYDEGMRMAPFKVGENYMLKNDLVEMMANFVRDPRSSVLDLKADIAVCLTLEKRVKAVLEEKGNDFFVGLCRKMLDETADAARKRLAAMNDGTYRQPVFLDNAGGGIQGIIRAMVAVVKQGDRVTIDFTGCSPRVVGGNFNAFPHAMVAMTACYLYQFLYWDLKPCIGVFEPFEFIFPEECFLNADPDDAISNTPGTVANVSTGVHMAFEKALFDTQWRDFIISPWGTTHADALAGMGENGFPFAAWDQGQPNGVGMGAQHDHDGTDAGGFIFCATGEFIDAELFESQYPFVTIFRNRYWKDAAGFGKYRGGRSISTAFLVYGTPFAVGIGLPGIAKMPVTKGLYGGYPSRPVATAYLKNNNFKEVIAQGRFPKGVEDLVQMVKGDLTVVHPNHGAQMLGEGDIVVGFVCGGPGYGDVMERDPELVIQDLREDAISDWTAQNIYHVVYDPETRVLNLAATEEKRRQARADRISQGSDWDGFMAEWSRKKPPEQALKWFGVWPEAITAS